MQDLILKGNFSWLLSMAYKDQIFLRPLYIPWSLSSHCEFRPASPSWFQLLALKYLDEFTSEYLLTIWILFSSGAMRNFCLSSAFSHNIVETVILLGDGGWSPPAHIWKFIVNLVIDVVHVGFRLCSPIPCTYLHDAIWGNLKILPPGIPWQSRG